MPHRLCSLRRILDQGNAISNLSASTAASLHFPIHDDNHNETVKRPALSLRVTLICDCICCIRGWPACHTRFDCSICQLLRCIFFVSHYLTETYLIGSMKVLMGLHRKFLRTILSMKKFTVCVNVKNRFKMFVSLFCLSSFSSVLFSSVLSCTSSNSLSLFHSEVCKISRGLQHWRCETYLQEGVHHPSAQKTSHPPAVGSVWGAAEWVSFKLIDTIFEKHWCHTDELDLSGCPARLCSGYVDEARNILKNLEMTIPGLAMVRLRRVSLERRHGNLDEAEALLREAMESSKTTTEMSFYAVKLARQHMKVQKSLSKARKVLLDAIEKDQVRSERRLWTED